MKSRACLWFALYFAAVVAVAVGITLWSHHAEKPQRKRVSVYTLEGAHDIGDARVVSFACGDPRALEVVLSSPHLEKLKVGYVDVSGVDFSTSEANKLIEVEFEACANLGRSAGRWIAQLPNLKVLRLFVTSVHHQFFSEAAKSASLKTLALWRVEGHIAAGATMCNAKALSTLSLSGIELNGKWRDALASASVLQALYIEDCRLTPEFTFESVPLLKDLRKVVVNQCEGANGAMFEPLLRATQLTEVDLTEQDGVTSDFLEYLRKQLPDAQIYPKVYPK